MKKFLVLFTVFCLPMLAIATEGNPNCNELTQSSEKYDNLKDPFSQPETATTKTVVGK